MSENKKTKIAEAVESSVKTMVDALIAAKSLNDKAKQGCRYLQAQIHSNLVNLCKDNPDPKNHTWKLAYENIQAMRTLVEILQNSEIPAWSRRYIAAFFEEYVGIPVVKSEFYVKGKYRMGIGIDTKGQFDISEINGKKSLCDSLWDKGEYPDIFPEKAAIKEVSNKAPKEEKSAKEKLKAFSKRLVSGEKKAIKENADLSRILDFVLDNYQGMLVISKYASSKECDDFAKAVDEKTHINGGAPKAP